jgi:chromosome segregation ATPase
MTNEDWIEYMNQSIASHDRQLGELTDKIAEAHARATENEAKLAQSKAETDVAFRELAHHMAKLADNMSVFSATVIHHEHRLNNIDGGA